jgi:4-amino-4-deoxy-L-arabinose transferase-like glycosyltransferase
VKLRVTAFLIFLWVLIVAAALLFRPLLPRDETRYISVAWEMWHSGKFLVPWINGVPYGHKPPLFFYLIHLGWFLFGVNEWSARLTGPFFGLLSLLLTAHLARRLWPGDTTTSKLSPFILLAMPLFAILTTLTMFDLMLCFFVLLSATGLLAAGRDRAPHGWIMVATGIGGGLLTKGPVTMVFVVPLGLLAPWWLKSSGQSSWWRWYSRFFVAVLIGVAIALLWAIPAAKAGGPEYGNAILWGQTAGRMVRSFAHRRPWWWYVPFVPLITLPWSGQLLRIRHLKAFKPDHADRFCLSWSVPAFVLLSITSGKQIHYLIPLLPPVSLLLARFLSLTILSPIRAELRIMAGLYLIAGIGLSLLPRIANWWAQLVPFSHVSIAWGIIFMVMGIIIFWVSLKDSSVVVMINCAAMILFIVLMHASVFRQMVNVYDVSPIATKIASLQHASKTIAIYPEKYANQFNFAGRLDAVIGIEDWHELGDWVKKYPNDYVVLFSSNLPPSNQSAEPEYVRRFMGRWTSFWQAKVFDRALIGQGGDLKRTASSTG